MTYVDPVTSQDWRDVASERQSDAATLYAGSRGVGALYFFGFVVESYAKALCVAGASQFLGFWRARHHRDSGPGRGGSRRVTRCGS